MRKNKAIKDIELTIQEFKDSGNGKGLILSLGDAHELVLNGLKSLLEIEIQKQKETLRQQKRAWNLKNPEKVKAAQEKRKEKLNTGNPAGRPRKEVNHEPGLNALIQRAYRKDNEKWKEYNRVKQMEWVLKNPERAKEIQKEYQRRKQRIKESTKNMIQTIDSMI
jgi:molecular chaperone DnaK (HSP70)